MLITFATAGEQTQAAGLVIDTLPCRHKSWLVQVLINLAPIHIKELMIVWQLWLFIRQLGHQIRFQNFPAG